jgi:hypothetical protein
MSKFLNRDFDTLVAEVLKRVKTKYGDIYTDFAASPEAVALVDLISFVAESVMFYTDERAKQSYLSLATESAAISRLARQNGYVMRAAVSGSTTVTFTLEQAYAFEVVVPAGFLLQASTGQYFETTEAVTFPASSTTPLSADVREGRTRTIQATSSGGVDQEIPLGVVDEKFIAQDSVIVLVDGIEWTRTDFLSFEESQEYEVLYLEDPPVIRFGNGISGAIPATGAEIVVSYVECSGRAGNVNQITSIVNALTYGSTTIDLTVVEVSRATGGDHPESIESVQANAPVYIASRGVAITKEDYYALSSVYSSPQYGAVAVAQAYVAREVSGDLEANNLIVDVEGAFSSYLADTTTDAESISDAFETIQTECTTQTSKLALVAGASSIASDNQQTIVDTSYAIAGQDGTLASAESVLETYLLPTSDDVLTLDELIDAMTTSSDGDITDLVADVEALKAALVTIESQIEDSRANITTSLGDLQDANVSIAAQIVVIDANVTALTTSKTTVNSTATTGKSISDALPATLTGYGTTMQTAFTALRTHLDEVLDQDGLSNLITVPILSIDSDGYYAIPSNGLIRTLEEYLEDRSDVAHLVHVVSGEEAMIEVDISVGIKPLTGYIYSELATQADTAIRLLLKRRRFGQDLYLSQVYALVQKIVGVDVFTVSFTCEEVELDATGNLIVPASQVIVPGTLSFSQLS